MSAPLCTVTPLEVRCDACNDTGSRYNSNFLDCTRCTAAIERSTFQSQIYSGEKISLDDKLWRAYQLGKAAGEATAVEGVLTEMQPGGALHQPATKFDEARILEIAQRMPVKPWGIGSRSQDAIEFAWEVLKAAAPVVPVAAQPEDEYNSFITAYRLWQAEEAPNSHPEMVHYMSDSHWKRAAGAMWRARAALAAPQPAASVTDVAKDAAVVIVPDWPFCNPACDYEDPHGGQHDERSAFCSCEQAKASICRQRAAIAAQQGEKT